MVEALTASYASGSCGTYTPYTWSFQEGACLVITGSYKLPEQPKVERKDAGVQEYFEILGYRVGWDQNYRRGQSWYELYDEDDHLVAQIDMGFPLADIIEDMIAWHEGRDATSKSDWACCGEIDDDMKLLWKRVHDYKLYGIMPNGQMTFPI